MGALFLGEPQATALFGKTRRRVLDLVFDRPYKTYHLRQIVEMVGCGMGAVQNELKRLSGAGIIVKSERGRRVLYQANEASPIFPEIQGLVIKTINVLDVLYRYLVADLRDYSPHVAFIYLSEKSANDINLIVIHSIRKQDSDYREEWFLDSVQKRLNRKVNAEFYPTKEFKDKLTTNSRFSKKMLQSQKIFIIGNEAEFNSLVGGTSSIADVPENKKG